MPRVPPAASRIAVLAALAVLPVALGACGRPTEEGGNASSPALTGVKGKSADAATDLGFPVIATKNTTRIAGDDPVADAAAAARAVFPSATAQTRPRAVVLVDRSDWRAALAASVLVAPPVRAPILFSDGDDVPPASRAALEALSPAGSQPAGGAQVIRVGRAPALARVKTTDVKGRTPAALARAIDAFSAAARGQTSDRVLVVSADHPEYAMPAAAWAAKSGDPILFVTAKGVPADTRAAIRAHQRPRIYVLGPSRVVPPAVTKQLRALGTVKRVGGQEPVTNAIAFARYRDGAFGWGVSTPGHGLVFAPQGADPATAAAVAPLSASGSYGPLLLLDRATALPKPLEAYLLDIQPGYAKDPVLGVYNRGWVIGDADAISPALQSTIDRLLEIVPVTQQATP